MRNENEGGMWIETMSWAPRAFVIHNFLTDFECEHVISTAEPQLQESLVFETAKTKVKQNNQSLSNTGVTSKIRTNQGTFIYRYQVSSFVVGSTKYRKIYSVLLHSLVVNCHEFTDTKYNTFQG